MNRELADFTAFAKHVVRVPQSGRSYRTTYGRGSYGVSSLGFSKEEIKEILESGDPASIRELSKYFVRFSGPYARVLQTYATLLTYGYLVVPHYNIESRPKRIKAESRKINQYVKDLHLTYNLPRINLTVLTEGIYFGLLLESDGKPSFYDLPAQYCRSRFLDEDGLPILEISLSYFDRIVSSDVERNQVLKLFPKYVQARYRNNKKSADIWVEIPPCDGGLCFFFNKDHTPPFVAAALAAQELEDARDREKTHDENELRKLLIQKLPINKADGELLFSLQEASILHDSVCNMLIDDDTIDVITTYADMALESVQDTDSAATASTARLEKYSTNLYNDLGMSSELFNASSGSTAMTLSLKKDISLMFSWSQQYQLAINALLRRKAKNDNLYFSIILLPTTNIFKKDDVDLYLKTAQYGYPKSAVSSALGIDLVDLSQLTDYENDVLELQKSLVPLQSSYTSSSSEISESEKNKISEKKNDSNSTPSGDILNEGGRPQKDVEERSDKTNNNVDGLT